jgi:hypothetical protein
LSRKLKSCSDLPVGQNGKSERKTFVNGGEAEKCEISGFPFFGRMRGGKRQEGRKEPKRWVAKGMAGPERGGRALWARPFVVPCSCGVLVSLWIRL